MSFPDDIKRFSMKVEARTQAIFVGSVAELHTAIVEGSAITGSPGQPVHTGNLRGSWKLMFESAVSALISTAVSYARHVEENVRGVVFRNHGAHSVALAIAGWQRIVETVAKRLDGGR